MANAPRGPFAEAGEGRLSKTRYIDLCRRLRNEIRAKGLASEAEVAAVYPSADDSWGKIVHAYAMLHRMCERVKFLKHGSDHATRQLLAALADEPVEVELVGRTATVTVHPKSEVSLRWMEDTYWLITWLSARHEVLREKLDEGDTESLKAVEGPLSAVQQLRAEIDYQVSLVCWAACHDGPGLPWGYNNPAPDEVPDEWYDLHPLDMMRIEAAIFEANIGRLQLLPKPKERGGGISPDVFFAKRARATTKSVRQLRMDESLAAQVAGLVLEGSEAFG